MSCTPNNSITKTTDSESGVLHIDLLVSGGDSEVNASVDTAASVNAITDTPVDNENRPEIVSDVISLETKESEDSPREKPSVTIDDVTEPNVISLTNTDHSDDETHTGVRPARQSDVTQQRACTTIGEGVDELDKRPTVDAEIHSEKLPTSKCIATQPQSSLDTESDVIQSDNGLTIESDHTAPIPEKSATQIENVNDQEQDGTSGMANDVRVDDAARITSAEDDAAQHDVSIYEPQPSTKSDISQSVLDVDTGQFDDNLTTREIEVSETRVPEQPPNTNDGICQSEKRPVSDEDAGHPENNSAREIGVTLHEEETVCDIPVVISCATSDEASTQRPNTIEGDNHTPNDTVGNDKCFDFPASMVEASRVIEIIDVDSSTETFNRDETRSTEAVEQDNGNDSDDSCEWLSDGVGEFDSTEDSDTRTRIMEMYNLDKDAFEIQTDHVATQHLPLHDVVAQNDEVEEIEDKREENIKNAFDISGTTARKLLTLGDLQISERQDALSYCEHSDGPMPSTTSVTPLHANETNTSEHLNTNLYSNASDSNSSRSNPAIENEQQQRHEQGAVHLLNNQSHDAIKHVTSQVQRQSSDEVIIIDSTPSLTYVEPQNIGVAANVDIVSSNTQTYEGIVALKLIRRIVPNSTNTEIGLEVVDNKSSTDLDNVEQGGRKCIGIIDCSDQKWDLLNNIAGLGKKISSKRGANPAWVKLCLIPKSVSDADVLLLFKSANVRPCLPSTPNVTPAGANESCQSVLRNEPVPEKNRGNAIPVLIRKSAPETLRKEDARRVVLKESDNSISTSSTKRSSHGNGQDTRVIQLTTSTNSSKQIPTADKHKRPPIKFPAPRAEPDSRSVIDYSDVISDHSDRENNSGVSDKGGGDSCVEVSNIPPSVTKCEVMNFFKGVAVFPGSVHLPSGVHVCYIELMNVRDFIKALSFSGKTFRSSTVNVKGIEKRIMMQRLRKTTSDTTSGSKMASPVESPEKQRPLKEMPNVGNTFVNIATTAEDKTSPTASDEEPYMMIDKLDCYTTSQDVRRFLDHIGAAPLSIEIVRKNSHSQAFVHFKYSCQRNAGIDRLQESPWVLNRSTRPATVAKCTAEEYRAAVQKTGSPADTSTKDTDKVGTPVAIGSKIETRITRSPLTILKDVGPTDDVAKVSCRNLTPCQSFSVSVDNKDRRRVVMRKESNKEDKTQLAKKFSSTSVPHPPAGDSINGDKSTRLFENERHVGKLIPLARAEKNGRDLTTGKNSSISSQAPVPSSSSEIPRSSKPLKTGPVLADVAAVQVCMVEDPNMRQTLTHGAYGTCIRLTGVPYTMICHDVKILLMISDQSISIKMFNHDPHNYPGGICYIRFNDKKTWHRILSSRVRNYRGCSITAARCSDAEFDHAENPAFVKFAQELEEATATTWMELDNVPLSASSSAVRQALLPYYTIKSPVVFEHVNGDPRNGVSGSCFVKLGNNELCNEAARRHGFNVLGNNGTIRRIGGAHVLQRMYSYACGIRRWSYNADQKRLVERKTCCLSIKATYHLQSKADVFFVLHGIRLRMDFIHLLRRPDGIVTGDCFVEVSSEEDVNPAISRSGPCRKFKYITIEAIKRAEMLSRLGFSCLKHDIGVHCPHQQREDNELKRGVPQCSTKRQGSGEGANTDDAVSEKGAESVGHHGKENGRVAKKAVDKPQQEQKSASPKDESSRVNVSHNVAQTSLQTAGKSSTSANTRVPDTNGPGSERKRAEKRKLDTVAQDPCRKIARVSVPQASVTQATSAVMMHNQSDSVNCVVPKSSSAAKPDAHVQNSATVGTKITSEVQTANSRGNLKRKLSDSDVIEGVAKKLSTCSVSPPADDLRVVDMDVDSDGSQQTIEPMLNGAELSQIATPASPAKGTAIVETPTTDDQTSPSAEAKPMPKIGDLYAKLIKENPAWKLQRWLRQAEQPVLCFTNLPRDVSKSEILDLFPPGNRVCRSHVRFMPPRDNAVTAYVKFFCEKSFLTTKGWKLPIIVRGRRVNISSSFEINGEAFKAETSQVVVCDRQATVVAKTPKQVSLPRSATGGERNIAVLRQVLLDISESEILQLYSEYSAYKVVFQNTGYTRKDAFVLFHNKKGRKRACHVGKFFLRGIQVKLAPISVDYSGTDVKGTTDAIVCSDDNCDQKPAIGCVETLGNVEVPSTSNAELRQEERGQGTVSDSIERSSSCTESKDHGDFPCVVRNIPLKSNQAEIVRAFSSASLAPRIIAIERIRDIAVVAFVSFATREEVEKALKVRIQISGQALGIAAVTSNAKSKERIGDFSCVVRNIPVKIDKSKIIQGFNSASLAPRIIAIERIRELDVVAFVSFGTREELEKALKARILIAGRTLSISAVNVNNEQAKQNTIANQSNTVGTYQGKTSNLPPDVTLNARLRQEEPGKEKVSNSVERASTCKETEEEHGDFPCVVRNIPLKSNRAGIIKAFTSVALAPRIIAIAKIRDIAVVAFVSFARREEVERALKARILISGQALGISAVNYTSGEAKQNTVANKSSTGCGKISNVSANVTLNGELRQEERGKRKHLDSSESSPSHTESKDSHGDFSCVVRNIPVKINKAKIIQAFSSASLVPRVIAIERIRDIDVVAFVSFATREELEKALEARIVVAGHALNISAANSNIGQAKQNTAANNANTVNTCYGRISNLPPDVTNNYIIKCLNLQNGQCITLERVYGHPSNACTGIGYVRFPSKSSRRKVLGPQQGSYYGDLPIVVAVENVLAERRIANAFTNNLVTGPHQHAVQALARTRTFCVELKFKRLPVSQDRILALLSGCEIADGASGIHILTAWNGGVYNCFVELMKYSDVKRLLETHPRSDKEVSVVEILRSDMLCRLGFLAYGGVFKWTGFNKDRARKVYLDAGCVARVEISCVSARPVSTLAILKVFQRMHPVEQTIEFEVMERCHSVFTLAFAAPRFAQEAIHQYHGRSVDGFSLILSLMDASETTDAKRTQ